MIDKTGSLRRDVNKNIIEGGGLGSEIREMSPLPYMPLLLRRFLSGDWKKGGGGDNDFCPAFKL